MDTGASKVDGSLKVLILSTPKKIFLFHKRGDSPQSGCSTIKYSFQNVHLYTFDEAIVSYTFHTRDGYTSWHKFLYLMINSKDLLLSAQEFLKI